MINLSDYPAFIDQIIQWFQTRAWDPYRFASPLVALAVQFVSRPFKKGLAEEHDRTLAQAGFSDSEQRLFVLRAAKDWDLRVSYFATAITTVFSVAAITHAFSGGGTLFAVVIAILFAIAVIVYPRIFKGPLGKVSTPFTEAGAKTRFQRFLVRKGWSRADFYSYLLRGVNILLLILILLTMPAK